MPVQETNFGDQPLACVSSACPFPRRAASTLGRARGSDDTSGSRGCGRQCQGRHAAAIAADHARDAWKQSIDNAVRAFCDAAAKATAGVPEARRAEALRVSLCEAAGHPTNTAAGARGARTVHRISVPQLRSWMLRMGAADVPRVLPDALVSSFCPLDFTHQVAWVDCAGARGVGGIDAVWQHSKVAGPYFWTRLTLPCDRSLSTLEWRGHRHERLSIVGKPPRDGIAQLHIQVFAVGEGDALIREL